MIAIHAHLYDGVDDDDIEEFNNKTPSDSFSQLLRGLWQASLFDNFQHFTFLFVSIFPALIFFKIKDRLVPEWDFFQRMWERDWVGSSSSS